MDSHHRHEGLSCPCAAKPSSVSQTLDEMEFERGIWTAVIYNEADRVKKFIDSGSVNARDNSGYTALHYAVRKGNLAMCLLLLDNGAEVDCQTKSGLSSPVQRAAMAGHKEVVKLLVERGASLQLMDANGMTALSRAIINKHFDVVEYILEVNPDQIHDSAIIQLAKTSQCPEMVNLFKSI